MNLNSTALRAEALAEQMQRTSMMVLSPLGCQAFLGRLNAKHWQQLAACTTASADSTLSAVGLNCQFEPTAVTKRYGHV